MSLIADALKKAQSAKLGRRYLAPDPSGVLPGARENRRGKGQVTLGSIFNQIKLSPTLLIGLGSGVLLFILLFSYFFYGRGPRIQSPSVRSSKVRTERSAGLILTSPPSVPAVEPLVLEKEGIPITELRGLTTRERTRTLEQTLQEPEVVRSKISKSEKTPRRQAGKGEPQKKRKSTKVAVTSDLSEEVRYKFNLALFYQEERNYPLARRLYEKVVQMWPLYAEAHNNLGVVYKELGLQGKAINELKKAVLLDPSYTRAYHNLGVTYQVMENWKQATKYYEKALSLDRNHLSSYNNLGLVYRSQKRPHKAAEVLEKALAINPAFSQTHYNLALVLEEIGELEQARLHYQKFIDLSGNENSRLVETVRTHLQGLVVGN